MSDNISHEDQHDWEQWIDWMDTQDWDSVGLGPGGDDALGVSWAKRNHKTLVSELCVDVPVLNSHKALELIDDPPNGVQPMVDPISGDSDFTKAGSVSLGEESDTAILKASGADDGGTKCTRRDLALQCPVQGCTYQGTFPRQWEIERHIRVKHNDGVKKFSCPVKGCFKGTVGTSFARSDKLTDHIRATHRLDATADCPMEDCTASLPLDLLIVHIRLRHEGWKYRRVSSRNSHHKWTEHAKSVINVASRRRCIYWSCSAKVPKGKMTDHLDTHSPAELESMQDDLLESGYLVVSSSESSENPKVKIVCPICKELSGSPGAFQDHLYGSHLADSEKIGQLSKVKAFKSIVKDVGEGKFTQYVSRRDGDSDVKCPGCQEDVTFGHRCDLFRQDSIPEVKAHRQLLLRLCPQIAEMDPWNNDDAKRAFFDDL